MAEKIDVERPGGLGTDGGELAADAVQIEHRARQRAEAARRRYRHGEGTALHAGHGGLNNRETNPQERLQPRHPARSERLIDSDGTHASFFVPGFVERRLLTLETRGPSPLVAAARATSPSQERVPRLTTPPKERLGSPEADTVPKARGRGSPTAERTSDPVERIFVVSCSNVDNDRP